MLPGSNYNDFDSRSGKKQFQGQKQRTDIFGNNKVVKSKYGQREIVQIFRNALINNELDSLDLLLMIEMIEHTFSKKSLVDFEDFKNIIRQFDIRINDEYIQGIVDMFLQDKRSVVDFIKSVGGKRNTKRDMVLMKLWARLDYNMKGYSFYYNIINLFKAAHQIRISKY